jgi:hypothetical protein
MVNMATNETMVTKKWNPRQKCHHGGISILSIVMLLLSVAGNRNYEF